MSISGVPVRKDVGLAAHLPVGTTWSQPAGGYFVWVALPSDIRADELLPIAADRGVAFLPGHRFFLDGGAAPSVLRLAFSMYPGDALEEATGRLGAAIDRLKG